MFMILSFIWDYNITLPLFVVVFVLFLLQADQDPRTIKVKLLTGEVATFIMKGNETVYKLNKLINGL